MLSRFFASRNLYCDDGVVHIRSFLDDPTQYLSWKSVEHCLTRDDVFWELIDKKGHKKNLQQYKPYWSPVPCQDKNTIYEHIQNKESFVFKQVRSTLMRCGSEPSIQKQPQQQQLLLRLSDVAKAPLGDKRS